MKKFGIKIVRPWSCYRALKKKVAFDGRKCVSRQLAYCFYFGIIDSFLIIIFSSKMYRFAIFLVTWLVRTTVPSALSRDIVLFHIYLQKTNAPLIILKNTFFFNLVTCWGKSNWPVSKVLLIKNVDEILWRVKIENRSLSLLKKR